MLFWAKKVLFSCKIIVFWGQNINAFHPMRRYIFVNTVGRIYVNLILHCVLYVIECAHCCVDPPEWTIKLISLPVTKVGIELLSRAAIHVDTG